MAKTLREKAFVELRKSIAFSFFEELGVENLLGLMIQRAG
jgi:hypothetical protein